jgi:hypothetical protein
VDALVDVFSPIAKHTKRGQISLQCDDPFPGAKSGFICTVSERIELSKREFYLIQLHFAFPLVATRFFGKFRPILGALRTAVSISNTQSVILILAGSTLLAPGGVQRKFESGVRFCFRDKISAGLPQPILTVAPTGN